MCLDRQDPRTATTTVHVRTGGRSYELAGDQIQLLAGAADRELVARAAELLGLEPSKLEGHAVDRHDDVVVIRPWAVWG